MPTEPDTLSNLAFSSAAALVARSATHPFDTLKTRIQFSTQRTSLLGLAARVVRTEPATALFRGLGVTLLFSVPGTAVYLTTYDELKQRLGARAGVLGGRDSLWVHALSGAGAEAVSGLFWTPMEVLKTKMQMGFGAQGQAAAAGSQPLTTARLAHDIFQAAGLRGFYRGYVLSQAVFIPYTMVYFVTYERLKRTWAAVWPTPARDDLPFAGYLTCASASGAVAGAVSNVLDVVKTRVQVSSNRSALDVVAHMWRHEGGALAFTKGMLARIMWVTPSMAISVTVYELLKDWRDRSRGSRGSPPQ
ncbi:hypothetical protein HK105_202008 [Polyrhizophydium stewartii]|uniref:Uncharacterized protein n=1 Tax=Polyrhizophydium stewartii TaxID=2732419 RepID=A0ABR4NGD5_9FUNG|nr:hypothetical protein HK105_003057 [Polyrhizophydium stewartii]